MKIPYPYESNNKPCAYRMNGGSFYLRNKTYPLRDKIKRLGGVWDWKNKCWICDEDAIKSLLKAGSILVIIQVRISAHCHEPEKEIFVTHKEVGCGYILRGCAHCDRTSNCGDVVKILEIIDKESAKVAGVELPSS